METVESVRRYTPNETGYCRNCGYRREVHSEEGQCPPRPKTLRRFVTRGGELVEIERVFRETR